MTRGCFKGFRLKGYMLSIHFNFTAVIVPIRYRSNAGICPQMKNHVYKRTCYFERKTCIWARLSCFAILFYPVYCIFLAEMKTESWILLSNTTWFVPPFKSTDNGVGINCKIPKNILFIPQWPRRTLNNQQLLSLDYTNILSSWYKSNPKIT